jgi:DNA-directed RNA polymerase
MSQVNSTSIINDDNTLFDIQLNMEMSMRTEGIEKMKRSISKNQQTRGESGTEYGHTLMVEGLHRFAVGVQEWFDQPVKAGRGSRVHKILKSGDAEVIAYVFMKSIINGISSKTFTLQNVQRAAAGHVEDEFRLAMVRAEDKALHQRLVDASNKRIGWSKRDTLMSGMKDAASKGKISHWEDWNGNDTIQVGSALLTILMQTVGLVKIVTESAGKHNKVKRLMATDETLEWITRRSDKAGLTTPVYKPLVIRPRDWTYENLTDGVYYTRHNRPVKLVKSSNRAYFDELKHADMDVVLYSINAMQGTAWSVNKPILKLLTDMWEAGVDWCPSIPSRHNQEEPEKLEDYDNASIQERAAYAQERNNVRIANREEMSKRFAFVSMTDTAQEFSQYDEFYFGMQLDFRGRVYSVSSYNCMGPDEMKATLQFAKGKALGEDGWKWLAIHLCNVGDFDKMSKATFEERVQWVMDNEDWIMDCVENPWENRRWAEADKPFLFMAAAMEWKGFLEQGDSFVSHIPASMDGSCSGLAHLAMAMKCKTTAASVNILPNDVMQDIYQIVADKVTARLVEDSQKPFEHWGEPVLNNMGGRVPCYTELALEWLNYGFGRKEAKTSTMTYSYGSKQYGFKTQIQETVMKKVKKDCARTGQDFPFSYDGGYRASSYIARLLWDSIVDTVKRPAQLMEWLTQAASKVAKTKFVMQDGSKQTMPVRWTTPLGLPVLQSYYNMETRRVRTSINGTIVYMNSNSPLDQICSRKSAQGMSPNYVHSLDSSHLMLAVARAKEEGIDDFMLIHDSFGTHCADTGRFGGIIREAMVEMYSNSDVVHDLYLELRAQLLPEDMDDFALPPAKGNLVLTDSLESRYSFA